MRAQRAGVRRRTVKRGCQIRQNSLFIPWPVFVCKDGFPVLDVTGVTFHYSVWFVFGTVSTQGALCLDMLLSAALVGLFTVSLLSGLPFLSPLRSPQTQTLCMVALFSVILESWMGTLHCLWIKHLPFSPENPAGQARPFDHGVFSFCFQNRRVRPCWKGGSPTQG